MSSMLLMVTYNRLKNVLTPPRTEQELMPRNNLMDIS